MPPSTELTATRNFWGGKWRPRLSIMLQADRIQLVLYAQ
jgi:hypothetical protein